MTQFFLNEHSVHGQYADGESFFDALQAILKARYQIERFGFSFYCDPSLRFCAAVGGMTFEQALRASGKKEQVRLVLSWLSRTGMFWAEAPVHSVDDLFACFDTDVTGSSLAEAASRHTAETTSVLISFRPCNRFNATPIEVTWTHNSGGETDVPLDNYWQLQPLLLLLQDSAPPLTKWSALGEWSARVCKNLLLSPEAFAAIEHEPFSTAAASEIQALLLILDEVSASHDAAGALNTRGRQLIGLWFQGHHRGSPMSRTEISKSSLLT